jgi:hypothetical protein
MADQLVELKASIRRDPIDPSTANVTARLPDKEHTLLLHLLRRTEEEHIKEEQQIFNNTIYVAHP